MMSKQRSSTEEVVDTEVHCVRCETRLYVPISQVDAVIASLQRTGAVILICVGKHSLSNRGTRRGTTNRESWLTQRRVFLQEGYTVRVVRPGARFIELRRKQVR